MAFLYKRRRTNQKLRVFNVRILDEHWPKLVQLSRDTDGGIKPGEYVSRLANRHLEAKK